MPALAQASAQPSDGPAFPVSEFLLTYVDPNPQFPSPEELAQVEVELTRIEGGFVRPRAAAGVVKHRLSELAAMGTQNFHESALRAINQQLVFEFNRRDFHAIVVSPLPEDIERRTGRDLRPPGVTRLRLGVYAGRVKDLHTLASGRVETTPEEAIDRPEHAWILERSPLQPTAPNDLVRKDQLDEFLARLNRQPTRRVDAEIRPAKTAGGVVVDYFVSENKPWWAYVVADDTGTEQTTKNRQRFGVVHANVSGRDDLAQLDYITGDFDEVNAVAASYEIPFDRMQRVKGRVFVTWSDYNAALQALVNTAFASEQIDAGFQLIVNAYQRGELFVDAIVGLQYEGIEVKRSETLGGGTADDDFALGMLGMRAERNGDISTLRGELAFLHNFAGLANTDGDELFELGRFGVDEEDFTLFRWNVEGSVFVAPVLSPRSWRDPKVLAAKSYAHEVALTLRGQHAFDRLIAQQEYVAGGLYSVRGYPESATAGDQVQLVGLEYRLHVPRLLAPDVRPMRLPGVGNFYARPKYDFTFPDWDLMVRAFLDYGHVDHIDPDPLIEVEEDLLGAGIGLEVRFKRFLTGRVDYGVALKDADLGNNEKVDSGDDQVHFSVTLLY